MNTECYGYHLMLRVGDIENTQALNNSQTIAGFLVTMVKRVKMRVLAGPVIGEEEGPLEKQGCSGVVILYESHAAIHTYPFLGEAFVDIFSCRSFDTDIVLATLEDFFGTYRVIEQSLVNRGIHWTANIKEEMGNWAAVR